MMIKFPPHAPLDDAQKQQLGGILGDLNSGQTAWLSGFLAGLEGPGVSPESESDRKLTVLYGTESGNSEELADLVFKAAKQKGFDASVVNMSEISAADLKGSGTLLVVVSTWGEGEPPEAAQEFYSSLMDSEVSLNGVSFSVCALGDTGYDLFCQTGKEIDARLEKLGAVRLVGRVDCDVDFESSFAAWNRDVWSALGDAAAGEDAGCFAAPAQVFDKKNPFPAEVLENQLLSGAHSDKEIMHIELSLDGSGLDYQPGDVLAVLPRNADDVVDGLIHAAGLAGGDRVDVKNVGEISLRVALTSDFDITGLSRKIANGWLEVSGAPELAALLADGAKAEYKSWADGRHVIDLLECFPAKNLIAQQLVDVLRKLPPRLYSIASSALAHPDEVHLTVAAVRYESHDKSRKGVASTFLADDAPKGSLVSVYVHHNKNFRLPEDSKTPVIMVGPGAGIAPFRAFVGERAQLKAEGDSWLIFGDQRYTEDFLYQLEWQEYLKNGSLTRLDVAFSRDQPEKVYVQHKLAAHASEVWKWFENGAHFYVCGDAALMAKDVHDTLLSIIASEGGKSEDEAVAYLTDMRKTKRYQRDVY